MQYPPLHVLLQRNKLSRAHFARMCGVSRRTVDNWVAQRTRTPQAARALALLIDEQRALSTSQADMAATILSGDPSDERVSDYWFYVRAYAIVAHLLREVGL